MQTPFPYDSENMEDKKRESKTVENRWSDYGTMLESNFILKKFAYFVQWIFFISE